MLAVVIAWRYFWQQCSCHEFASLADAMLMSFWLRHSNSKSIKVERTIPHHVLHYSTLFFISFAAAVVFLCCADRIYLIFLFHVRSFTRLEKHFNCINYGDVWMAISQGGRQVSDWFPNKCSQSHFFNTAMCQWWESRIAHSRLKNILIHLFSPRFLSNKSEKTCQVTSIFMFSTHLSSHLWLLNDIAIHRKKDRRSSWDSLRHKIYNNNNIAISLLSSAVLVLLFFNCVICVEE